MQNYEPQDVPPQDLMATWFAGAARNRNNFFHLNNIPAAAVTMQTLIGGEHNYGPRPRRLEGVLLPHFVGNREVPPQPSTGYNTHDIPNVDPGHLGALSLGFGEYSEIVVPQWSDWQRNGAWRIMEREVYQYAIETIDASRPINGIPRNSIYYTVEITYQNFGPNVCPRLQVWAFPTRFLVRIYYCDLLGNYDPNEIFKEWDLPHNEH